MFGVDAGSDEIGSRATVSKVLHSSGRNRVKLFFFLGGGGPYPGADTGFPEGGVKTYSQAPPPPWDKHPPPPLDIARVTSSTFQRGVGG